MEVYAHTRGGQMAERWKNHRTPPPFTAVEAKIEEVASSLTRI